MHNAEIVWKLSRVLEDFSGSIDEDVVSAVMDDYDSLLLFICSMNWLYLLIPLLIQLHVLLS
eukprot:8183381-Ditylum_brightwellii.AAC.2